MIEGRLLRVVGHVIDYGGSARGDGKSIIWETTAVRILIGRAVEQVGSQ
jgi:hypothetical protein